MAKILPLRSADEGTSGSPALHDRAMDNLQFIRTTMEQAGAFTALSGWGMVAVGIIAIGTALLAASQPTMDRWLHVWLAAGATSLVVQLWALMAKARGSGIPLFSGPGRKFILAVSPTIFAGAVLTIVFYRAGIAEVIPGMWLLLYGAAVAAGGTSSVEIVPLMGLCFLFAGTFALITPVTWNNWILGVSFGGFHIVFGILIARRYGG